MSQSFTSQEACKPNYTGCPGKARIHGASGPWFIPPGFDISQNSICWYCYTKYIQGTAGDKGFTVQTSTSQWSNCNCDFETTWVKECPGVKRLSGKTGPWFIRNGKSASETTYCLHCFNQHFKGTDEENNFLVQWDLPNCNCDYQLEQSPDRLKKDEFEIMLVNTKTGQLFPLRPDEAEETANLNGVGHFILPTCVDYEILIRHNSNTGENVWFRMIKGTLGKEKEIVLNDGRTIYHNGNLDLKSVKTGTYESFRFYSPSKLEKYQGKTVEGENETNIIHLEFQKYIRKPSEVISMGYQKQSASLDSQPILMYESYSGGATVPGGLYTGHLNTKTTHDTFEAFGDPVTVTLQLICNQTDEEKYKINMEHKRQQDIKERDRMLHEADRLKREAEYKLQRVTNLEEQIARLMKEVHADKEKEEKIRNDITELYSQLGSPNQEDHLMNFSA